MHMDTAVTPRHTQENEWLSGNRLRCPGLDGGLENECSAGRRTDGMTVMEIMLATS